jgi:hypothetical protein
LLQVSASLLVALLISLRSANEDILEMFVFPVHEFL